MGIMLSTSQHRIHIPQYSTSNCTKMVWSIMFGMVVLSALTMDISTAEIIKARAGKNCPAPIMITDEAECRQTAADAAAIGVEFGISFDSRNRPGMKVRPAGCYWDQNGKINFNQNIDAVPEFKHAGGLCKIIGGCVTSLECNSNQFEYATCHHELPQHSVTLLNKVSVSECNLHTSFGVTTGSKMWVDDGCRGQFQVCNNEDSCETLHCSSHGFQYAECAHTVPENALNISLVRQKSQSACTEGTSYGINADTMEMWVDQGCRGVFDICIA